MNDKNIKLFENTPVRSVWDENEEKYWLSVVDIIGILTDQTDYTKIRNYWKWLKNKLISEGSQLVSNTNQLKLEASDGKKYLTDVMDIEQIFRLIQSIPSKKAEPFKLWLAKVGRERIDDMIDPEIAIDRAISYYRMKGYSEKWINQRMKVKEVRKELTDEWDKSGVKEAEEYAILTDVMTKVWSDKTVKEYKKHKRLKKENLRDNMTNIELVLTMLAEVTATDLSRATEPKGFTESLNVAREGASAAKVARQQYELTTGKSAISDQNARDLNQITLPFTEEPPSNDENY